MDDLIPLAFVAIVFLLIGIWIGRHPERVRQAEQRMRAMIHERTAPHVGQEPKVPTPDPPKPPAAAP